MQLRKLQNLAKGEQRRFPHAEPFAVGGHDFSAAEVIAALGAFLRPRRRARIHEVAARRTCSVAVVLDGLYDRGNVSAVLRSAEALGYLRVHLIQTSGKFKAANRATQGADKWLDVQVWHGARRCVELLRQQGYRVLAAHLDEDAQPIEAYDFTVPTALVLGNEHEGVSDEVLGHADGSVVIPMSGFTQSFNISVAAALCLYHIKRDREQRQGSHHDLTAEEQRLLEAAYYLRSVPNAKHLLLRAREGQ